MNPLRRWRINQKLRVIEVALRLGVSEHAVHSWERGAFKPSSDAYTKIAQITGINEPELRQSWTNWLLEVRREMDARFKAIAPLPPSIGLRDNV